MKIRIERHSMTVILKNARGWILEFERFPTTKDAHNMIRYYKRIDPRTPDQAAAAWQTALNGVKTGMEVKV